MLFLYIYAAIHVYNISNQRNRGQGFERIVVHGQGGRKERKEEKWYIIFIYIYLFKYQVCLHLYNFIINSIIYLSLSLFSSSFLYASKADLPFSGGRGVVFDFYMRSLSVLFFLRSNCESQYSFYMNSGFLGNMQGIYEDIQLIEGGENVSTTKYASLSKCWKNLVVQLKDLLNPLKIVSSSTVGEKVSQMVWGIHRLFFFLKKTKYCGHLNHKDLYILLVATRTNFNFCLKRKESKWAFGFSICFPQCQKPHRKRKRMNQAESLEAMTYKRISRKKNLAEAYGYLSSGGVVWRKSLRPSSSKWNAISKADSVDRCL